MIKFNEWRQIYKETQKKKKKGNQLQCDEQVPFCFFLIINLKKLIEMKTLQILNFRMFEY